MTIEHKRREPAPGVFRLVLPLPFPGLHRVNAYLLTDGSAATLVDCGIYLPSDEDDHGWDDLVRAIEAAGVSVDSIERLIVTHTHIDHYGMAARVLEASGCELWMHSAADEELEGYRDPQRTTNLLRTLYEDHGVRADELDELTRYEDWRGFVSGVVEATTKIEGDDSVDVGDRTWRFVHTPGHAVSHVCLFSESDSILISGDHLLPSITPHIDFKRGPDSDPLGDFLGSLQKVEKLAPNLVLPGHGHPFEDGAERARVVERHHDRRLGAILQVIRHRPATAEEITDEIFGEDLLDFHRRLALGEALAHLAYLRKQGDIERSTREDGTFVYRKRKRSRPSEDDE